MIRMNILLGLAGFAVAMVAVVLVMRTAFVK
ncbi:hypothetical protein C5L18_000563 [Lactobacillus amylolyticus]|nr:hypothetical protein C5L18_000563 [Lactobacillus amylolyticus]